MKNRVLWAFSAAFLAGCATSGDPQVGACLQPGPISEAFFDSPSPRKTLVGGIGPAGEVQCYWSDNDTGLLVISPAWKACKADANACTFLADSKGVYFKGYERDLRPAAGPNAFVPVAWYLLGQFAQGVAYGIGQGLTAPAPGFYGASAASAPVEASSPAPRSRTTCRPIGGPSGGFPTYVCR